jgi:hypothetical protein
MGEDGCSGSDTGCFHMRYSLGDGLPQGPGIVV